MLSGWVVKTMEPLCLLGRKSINLSVAVSPPSAPKASISVHKLSRLTADTQKMAHEGCCSFNRQADSRAGAVFVQPPRPHIEGG